MAETKKTYGEKLLDPRWQRMRLKILERDSFTCTYCGDSKSTLHVHHGMYMPGKDPWEVPEYCLLTLCADCHDFTRTELTVLEKYLLECLFNRDGLKGMVAWKKLIRAHKAGGAGCVGKYGFTFFN